MTIRTTTAAMVALAVAGCATTPSVPRWSAGDPPAIVHAVVETVVTTDAAVDADDPALWADSKEPLLLSKFKSSTYCTPFLKLKMLGVDPNPRT